MAPRFNVILQIIEYLIFPLGQVVVDIMGNLEGFIFYSSLNIVTIIAREME